MFLILVAGVTLARGAMAVKPNETLNVLGTKLIACGREEPTGFYRDGHCVSGPDDHGVHVVCAEVTDTFLNYTKSRGNDLSTPSANFPGLKAGDRWCLCAARWKEAHDAGQAPPVVLEATAQRALDFVTLEQPKAAK